MFFKTYLFVGRVSSATHELIFKAENIPALGFKSYFISKNAQVASEQVVIGDELPTSGRQTKTILGEYLALDYVNYKSLPPSLVLMYPRSSKKTFQNFFISKIP